MAGSWLIPAEYSANRLIVLSRDELEQFEMAQDYSPPKFSCMLYFPGDIRDLDRLKKAFSGVGVVIHATVIKQVPVPVPT